MHKKIFHCSAKNFHAYNTVGSTCQIGCGGHPDPPPFLPLPLHHTPSPPPHVMSTSVEVVEARCGEEMM